MVYISDLYVRGVVCKHCNTDCAHNNILCFLSLIACIQQRIEQFLAAIAYAHKPATMKHICVSSSLFRIDVLIVIDEAVRLAETGDISSRTSLLQAVEDLKTKCDHMIAFRDSTFEEFCEVL